MIHFVSQLQVHFHPSCSSTQDAQPCITSLGKCATSQSTAFCVHWLYASRWSGIKHSGTIPLELVKPFLAENQAYELPHIPILSKSCSSSISVWEHKGWKVAAFPRWSLSLKIGSGFIMGLERKSMFHCLPCVALTEKFRTGQWSSSCSCSQRGHQMPLQQRGGTVEFCLHREIVSMPPSAFGFPSYGNFTHSS